MTEFVTTRNGASIAFDRAGSGPPVILVGGAFQHRALDEGTRNLTEELAGRGFTVVHYDRPGRGETRADGPYGLDAQIDALRALLVETGPAVLYGSSSGGAISLAAAAAGLPVTGLMLWETPLGPELGTDGPEALTAIRERIAGGDPDGVPSWFLGEMIGVPAEHLAGIRRSPGWPTMVAVGPSLEGDVEALAWAQTAPHAELFGSIDVPVDVILCEQTQPIMESASASLRAALPQAREVRVPGANHQWELPGLVSAIEDFLTGSRPHAAGPARPRRSGPDPARQS